MWVSTGLKLKFMSSIKCVCLHYRIVKFFTCQFKFISLLLPYEYSLLPYHKHEIIFFNNIRQKLSLLHTHTCVKILLLEKIDMGKGIEKYSKMLFFWLVLYE